MTEYAIKDTPDDPVTFEGGAIQMPADSLDSVDGSLARIGVTSNLSRRESKKTSASTEVGVAAAADKIDIDAEVSEIAAHWRKSSTHIIAAGARLSRVWKKLHGNDKARSAILIGLREKGVLSENDIKLPHRTSKVSKLIKIGDNEKLLLQDKLRSYLPPSYASIHQLLVLFERLKGSPEEKVAELINIVAGCKDEITWEFLSQATKNVTGTKQNKTKPSALPPLNAAEPDTVREPASQQPGGELSDLLLITPRPEEIRRFRETYADPTTLHQCLPLHRYLAETAVVVVVTTLSELSVIETKLLPLCGAGFKRPRILLPRCPTCIDVTTEMVFVIAERGDIQIDLPTDSWLGAFGPLEAAKVVKALLPAAKHRLHAFGDLQHDGWRRLSDADAWTDVPSVR